uniref:Uncharacterized protein n=1 Tax=Lepeophtheirus salmonis TaxID=72036 RepID=A0A0K2TVN3_LEPSM
MLASNDLLTRCLFWIQRVVEVRVSSPYRASDIPHKLGVPIHDICGSNADMNLSKVAILKGIVRIWSRG